MITSKKRSSVTVSKSAIDQATETLQSLPEKPKEGWSLREAIDQMNGVLTVAIEKGYSYEELVDLLRDQGIEISVSSLKNYLTRSKRDSASTAADSKTAAKTKATPGGKRRGRKPKSASDAGSSAGEAESMSGFAGDRPDPSSKDEAMSENPDAAEPGELTEPTRRGRRARSSARSTTVAKAQSGTNQTQVSASTNGRKTRRKKNESVAS